MKNSAAHGSPQTTTESKRHTSLLREKIVAHFHPRPPSHAFYQHTKFAQPVVAPPVTKWPKSWIEIGFKSYPRAQRVILPKPQRPASFLPSFAELVMQRRTVRQFAPEPCSLQELSDVLQYCVGVQHRDAKDWNLSHRVYPSGGARFPVEVYLLAVQPGELPVGVYHYHFKTHALEVIKPRLMPADVARCFGDPWIHAGPYILILSGVFFRSEVKYKARGMRHVFLEAGHISQNVYLATQMLQLGCSALGGFVEDQAHELLELDGEAEGIVHALIFGPPAVLTVGKGRK